MSDDDLPRAAEHLANEAARAVTSPRWFHENVGDRQQALGHAVANVRAALTARPEPRAEGLRDLTLMAVALHATAVPGHNLGEGPLRAVCDSPRSHEPRAAAILERLAATPPAPAPLDVRDPRFVAAVDAVFAAPGEFGPAKGYYGSDTGHFIDMLEAALAPEQPE